MSEESPFSELGVRRHLRDAEKTLVEQLLQRAHPRATFSGNLDDVEVQEMSDGGMGSLRFVPTKSIESRRFGVLVAELLFNDSDGVAILASLFVDKEGDLYELDILKVDFSPTISLAGAIQPNQK